MEAPQVSQFRQRILDGNWHEAEESLRTLGVPNEAAYVVATVISLLSPADKTQDIQISHKPTEVLGAFRVG